MKNPFDFEDARHVITFGKGKSGILIQGYLYKPTNILYAIKSVSFQHPNYHRLVIRLENEAKILSRIQQNACNDTSELSDKSNEKAQTEALDRLSFYRFHVINSFGIVEKQGTVPPTICLRLESCLGGNISQHLHHQLNSDEQFSFFQIRVYITQLVNVLLYFSSLDIVHRDIKLSNILLNSYGHIKLCDFDSAIILSSRENRRTRTIIGTLHLFSPEMIAYGQVSSADGTESHNDCGYDNSVDFWSLGHLLYELITKKPVPLTWFQVGNKLFHESNENKQQPEEKEENRNFIHVEHQRIAQEALEMKRSVECWDYSLHHSALLVNAEKEEQPKETKSTNKVIDFASFIPDSLPINHSHEEDYDHSRQFYQHANDFISSLLKINPTERIIYSSLHRHSYDDEQRKNNQTTTNKWDFYQEKEFQSSLFHPFLVEEILFPNDLMDYHDYSDFVDSFLSFHRQQTEENDNKEENEKKRKKKKSPQYSFPINEKIGFYEMFPQFHERKNRFRQDEMKLHDDRSDRKDHDDDDDDELTEEQQLLFKDF